MSKEIKSATEMFLNRDRAAVAPRVDEVAAQQGQRFEINAVAPIAPAPVTETTPDIQSLQTELAAMPPLIRMQMRVERDCGDQINQVASDRKLTPETLMQGVWTVIHDNPKLLEAAIAEAAKAKERRKRAGLVKTLISQLSKMAK